MQGQGFRDRGPEFAALGAVVVGASFDTVEENRAFAEAQELGFALLSDTTREVGRAYGVVKPPTEQWADFPRRRTFLIDPEGVVRRIDDVTDVAADPDVVLAAIRALRSPADG